MSTKTTSAPAARTRRGPRRGHHGARHRPRGGAGRLRDTALRRRSGRAGHGPRQGASGTSTRASSSGSWSPAAATGPWPASRHDGSRGGGRRSRTRRRGGPGAARAQAAGADGVPPRRPDPPPSSPPTRPPCRSRPSPRPSPGAERVLGMHFFNPVHIMALVEVVQGDRTPAQASSRPSTSPSGSARPRSWCTTRPGSPPPGSASRSASRPSAWSRRAWLGPQDIDTAMELGYRHPMGPLRLTDLVGPRRAARDRPLPAQRARQRAVPAARAPGADGGGGQARARRPAGASTSGTIVKMRDT